MPRSDDSPNGHPVHGHPDNTPSLDGLILETESLRTALAEVCVRLGQLGVNLERHRRRSRAIEGAPGGAAAQAATADPAR